MNGYEFVNKILGHSNYDVAPLIDLAKGSETEWLEFKAAIEPPTDGSKNPKENKWDYRLDVSKALFAMANSVGGAVIIGINEDKVHPGSVEPVNLEHSGFSGDMDKFIRDELKDRVLHPVIWKTGTEGTWVCRQPHDLFRPIRGEYKGESVIIILVKPRAKEDGWLQFEGPDDSCSTMVVCRCQGDVGQNEKKKANELVGWWNNRETDRSDLNQRYQLFLEKWKQKGRHSDSEVSDVIQRYLKTLLVDYSKRHLDSLFIPLYARARDSKNKPAGNIDVLTLLQKQQQLILLGDPGSGKSTCLLQRAGSLAEGWQIGSPLALLIPLQEYTEIGLRSLILSKLPGLYWIDIENKINSGELILFFDALNECPSVYYAACHQELNGLLKDYSSVSIAITTRLTHNPIFKSSKRKILPTFDVLPLGSEQQLQFLNNYLDTEQSLEVLEQLSKGKGTEFIASSPVLLKMVVSIWNENKSIPSGVAQLYHRHLQVWHERESRKEGAPFLWKFREMLDALAMLSFHTRKEGKVSCSVNFARDAVNRVLGDEARSAGFVNRVAQGLLLERDDKAEFLHFSHETIQEYLTAEYLAANPGALTQELLKDDSGNKSSNWAMPMVFVLELMGNPPKVLLESAWFYEPLMVAASLRNSDRLSHLPMKVHEDLWLRGALSAMRGEVDIAESRKLSYISHTPPKYPLPTVLLASLRSASFWYAAQTHDEGKKRLERLRQLITDRNSVWIELLPHAIAGHPEWNSYLSLPQKLLIGETEHKSMNVILDDVSIIELCTLLRYRKIRDHDFIARWQDALQNSKEEDIETNLLALLRTERYFHQKRALKFSDFSNEHKNILERIGKNWMLSLRLVNILVRERILAVNDIRNDPRRIQNIISRASSINLFRFLINGIIKKGDFSVKRLKEVLSDLEKEHPGRVNELREKRLIDNLDSKSSRRDMRYLNKDLDNKIFREGIASQIKGRQWDVRVDWTSDDGKVGFVSNSHFPDGVYVLFDRINNTDYRPIARGDTLRVFIEVNFDKKKDRWGFAVTAGNIA